MGSRIDSYITNWLLVTNLDAVEALIETFVKRNEPCASGMNWHVERGMGDSIRIVARDLHEAHTQFREQDGKLVCLETELRKLLQPSEVFVWTNISWNEGTPHFARRIYFEGSCHEATSTTDLDQARRALNFPPEKVVL